MNSQLCFKLFKFGNSFSKCTLPWWFLFLLQGCLTFRALLRGRGRNCTEEIGFLNTYLVLNLSFFLKALSQIIIWGIWWFRSPKFLLSFSIIFIQSLLKTLSSFHLLFLKLFLNYFFSNRVHMFLWTGIIKEELPLGRNQKSIINFHIFFASIFCQHWVIW